MLALGSAPVVPWKLCQRVPWDLCPWSRLTSPQANDAAPPSAAGHANDAGHTNDAVLSFVSFPCSAAPAAGGCSLLLYPCVTVCPLCFRSRCPPEHRPPTQGEQPRWGHRARGAPTAPGVPALLKASGVNPVTSMDHRVPTAGSMGCQPHSITGCWVPAPLKHNPLDANTISNMVP